MQSNYLDEYHYFINEVLKKESVEDSKEEERVKEETPTVTHFIPSLNQVTTDVDKLNKRIFFIGKRREMRCTILGVVEPGNEPIILLTPKKLAEDVPRILVIGGMHGNEPCGPYAILRALNTLSDEILSKCNLSFIPCINPYGLRMGDRSDVQKDDPNRGYIHQDEVEQKDTSQSGDVLMQHKKVLLNLGRDCFVSLHEDWEQKEFYCYVNEKGKEDGDKEALSNEIIETAKSHFPIRERGEIGSARVTRGVVKGTHDGSFEDFMFDNLSKICVTIETPGLEPIDERMLCAVDCLETIINYVSEIHK